MEKIEFDDSQCVLIENEEQFLLYYPEMRSAKRGVSYTEWVRKFGKLNFPFYLENSHSVHRGRSIGMTTKPFNTWTKDPLEVLKFKATNN